MYRETETKYRCRDTNEEMQMQRYKYRDTDGAIQVKRY
jgi:hypothetical protein